MGLINPGRDRERIFARGYYHATQRSWWGQWVVPFRFLYPWTAGTHFDPGRVSAFFVSVVKDPVNDVGGAGRIATTMQPHSITQDEPGLLTNLPQVRRLRGLVEHSDWHDDDPFEQALRLFHWVQQLPGSLPTRIDAPEMALRRSLSSVIDPANGGHTVQALLAFAALIHDVGKAETFQRLPDGTTRCPEHEAASARMAPDICARFDLTAAETHFVVHLVGAHGEPYALLKRIAPLPFVQQQEQMRRFESAHADYTLPLLLLALGDLVTSQLQTIREPKYEAVFDLYRLWMQTLWSREGGKTQTDGHTTDRSKNDGSVPC